MPDELPRPLRRDAAHNRDRIIQAARVVFAEQGHQTTLEEIARSAGVSRTTLYRNFLTREELTAFLYSDNVSIIEARARELADDDDGVVKLLDFILEQQSNDRGLARMLSSQDIELFTELSARTASAFLPLVERGRESGLLHDGVTVDDVMTALAMSSGALADIDLNGREHQVGRVRQMLHRALFTTK